MSMFVEPQQQQSATEQFIQAFAPQLLNPIQQFNNLQQKMVENQFKGKSPLTLNEELNQVKSRVKSKIDSILLPHIKKDAFGGTNMEDIFGEQATKEAKEAYKKTLDIQEQASKVMGNLYTKRGMEIPGDLLEMAELMPVNKQETQSEPVSFDKNNKEHIQIRNAILKEAGNDRNKAREALLKVFK